MASTGIIKKNNNIYNNITMFSKIYINSIHFPYVASYTVKKNSSLYTRLFLIFQQIFCVLLAQSTFPHFNGPMKNDFKY